MTKSPQVQPAHIDNKTSERPAPAGRRRLSVMEQAHIGKSIGANKTLAELVLERTGGNHVTAMHVLSYVAIYGVFVEQHGREPRSVLELAHGAKRRSRATVDRWSTKFREAFPEYAYPTMLWAIAREQIVARDEDVIALHLGAVET